MTREHGVSAAGRVSTARRRRREPPWSEWRWRYDAELAKVLADVRHIREPASRAWQAGRLIALKRELHEIRRDAVRQLRDRGMTWAEIGECLEISRARAHALGR